MKPWSTKKIQRDQLEKDLAAVVRPHKGHTKQSSRVERNVSEGELDTEEPTSNEPFTVDDAIEQGRAALRASESANKKPDELDRTNVRSIHEQITKNRAPILYVSEVALGLIDESYEATRGSNSISEHEKQPQLEALSKLRGLVLELQAHAMSPAIAGNESSQLEVAEPVESWPSRFACALEEDISKLIDPENVAAATIPTGVILLCGALGALAGGAVGFGAGSVVGHLLTGQMKPGSAAKALEANFDDDG